MEVAGKKKLAVLVGCNYPNSPNELHGCINDVLAMRQLLVNRFGFEPTNIELLTDDHDHDHDHGAATSSMPTGANIKKALGRMVDRAQPGDVLYFHYSGHGTTIPSTKPGHPFRQHEAIVPCDFNLITDLDFRQVVNRVPEGASLTILSDSCHSGGLIDKEKEQIGPGSITDISKPKPKSKPKTIPFSCIVDHLSSLTNINSSDMGTHLLELFGSEASLRFRLPLLDLDLFQPLRPDQGILLSGCQADETSADMDPTMAPDGKAYGAFSNALHTLLTDHPAPFTNRELVLMARNLLQHQGFRQHPCLYSTDHNADATFLLQQQPHTNS